MHRRVGAPGRASRAKGAGKKERPPSPGFKLGKSGLAIGFKFSGLV